MTLGNMRELGAHHLIAYCLNDVSWRAAGQPKLACTQVFASAWGRT